MTEVLGPNLFDALIKEKRTLSLKDMQTILRDILRCLKLLKNIGIIHCDLKPENILFKSESSKNVKVIDFGSATFIDDNEYDYLQTRPYRAPEICFGCKFDFSADMWSVGCILYEIATSKVLFSYQSVQENIVKAMAINQTFSADHFADGKKASKYLSPQGFVIIEHRASRPDPSDLEVIVPRFEYDISSELKKVGCDSSLINFIVRCLAFDPGHRITVEEALDHEFVKRSYI